MEIALPAFVSFVASLLTLFSGFGLGTLLFPAFALFFPAELAVATTAVVHFLNNLFKLAFLGRFADKEVVLKFGLPAIAAAFLGAQLLSLLSDIPPLFRYTALGIGGEISPLKLVLGPVMLVFALIEFSDREHRFSFDRRYLLLGGILSGFFGGLSGHQGALRTMFLLRCNLEKKAFLASGIAIACLIDISRLTVYQHRFSTTLLSENLLAIGCSILSAFLGVTIGTRLLEKVTMKAIQRTVAAMLIVFALLLMAGLI
ncbi:MAG: sulfite exporter TauE/SafE family protein [Chloroherpetonaceae bacterium]|nr:sulfite exporter TauE/SafE family protein [Chloroherpetonaceae bacterium]MCS7212336.1 sulfite exporter TauE/SafE family protein [Chloroherpetonaceae bacterium]MDW8019407.1 sulfite exporter TauE/SafE family protein [Chloroherpetonaceae bacterium]MDW8466728.1 sulfite exporter TauE/SafE family protein [Chloroherpetonaceae bacterium]